VSNRVSNSVPYLALIAAALLLCAPILIHGAPDRSHDSPDHARWTNQFCTQFWSGEAYPRWLAAENGGFGGAAFFFYPPLPFYVGCAVWPIARHADPFGWWTAGFSFTLAAVFSGCSAFLWLRSLVSRRAALFGALVYLLAPYHLAIDLYTRGALAEMWAFVWMPLVLLFIDRSAIGRRGALAGLAISYALLIFSHLPATLMFSPAALVFAFRQHVFPRAALAMALGTGLAAIYLAPAMFEQDNVRLDTMTQGFYDYHNWWITSPANTDFRIGIVAATLATFGLSALLWRGSRFYFGVAAAALLLMTPLTLPIWFLIPHLKMVQFPWRFNGLLLLATAVLAAIGYERLRRLARAGLLAAAAIATFAMMPSAFAHDRQEDQLQREVPEYWPAVSSAEFPAREVELDSGGSTQVLSWRARHIELAINTPADATLTLAHFFYPGWKGKAGEVDVPVHTSEGGDGWIATDVPAGRYTLTLDLAPLPQERIGAIVSAASVLGLVVMLFSFV
jgi:uncharacterized membrane protein